VILDVRSTDEYTGANPRAKHGGHIPGAVHTEWTDATAGDNVLLSESELREMYASRGVTPDKEVIAHCQLGIRAAHTWFVLKHVLGYPNVRNYDGSWQEWGNRDDLPIERGQ
jgi:thiosulfate/3-mercaptopyruvate sulfurtransferase